MNELAISTSTMQKWQIPKNSESAFQLAQHISKSDLAPTGYKGKPENVLIAIQMGAEVGLSPMQALQNIAVINGRPTLWGDALLGLCRGHQSFRGIKEEVVSEKGKLVARCTSRRETHGILEENTVEFSQDDAQIAGLWGRNTWKQYPKRMLQMRARAFALRDMFADVLKGIQVREEVNDYHVKDISATAVVNKKKDIAKALGIDSVKPDIPEEKVNISKENTDDDNEPKKTNNNVSESHSEKAVNLYSLIDEYGLHQYHEKILKKHNVSSLEELPEEKLTEAYKFINSKINTA